jgi:hypothetical protein
MLQGAVAQLGERLVCNQEATGSIPVSSTKFSMSRWRVGGIGEPELKENHLLGAHGCLCRLSDLGDGA